MSILLAAIISSTSLLALVATAIWRPDKAISCAVQVLVLLVLLGIDATAPDSVARVALAVGTSALVIRYQRQGRLTGAAAILAGGISLYVILQYPPPWTLAIAFLLGWSNFVGALDQEAHPPDESKTRDMTDLAPAAMVVLLGATLVNTHPDVAAVIVFGALAFIVNDVLASDLGPQLPGGAYLVPSTTKVPHGTPGAMSYAGTLIGTLGSVSAGLCGGALLHSISLGVSVFLGGSAGALLDTMLSKKGVFAAVSRGRELINVTGCAFAIGFGLLML